MGTRITAIERALLIAKSGEVSSLTELRAKLKKEGYGNEADLNWGKGIKMQLSRSIREGKAHGNFTEPGQGDT